MAGMLERSDTDYAPAMDTGDSRFDEIVAGFRRNQLDRQTKRINRKWDRERAWNHLGPSGSSYESAEAERGGLGDLLKGTWNELEQMTEGGEASASRYNWDEWFAREEGMSYDELEKKYGRKGAIDYVTYRMNEANAEF